MRRPVLAMALAASACALGAPGASPIAFAQGSLPIVALLRATGESKVNMQFRQALRDLGHEDGRTIRVMDYAAGNDLERLATLSARIVSDRPAIVVAMGPAAAKAIKASTSSIPIVAFTSFPVELGLANSLARPGGNLTGVSLVTTELDAKRLSLLGELVPAAKRIAVLRDPAVGSPEHESQLEAAARALGITIDVVEARRPDEIATALRLAKSRGANALSVLASPMLNVAAGEIARQALEAGLASMCQWREMAEVGCLISYGPSLMDSYRLTATQMDRVLRGANPAELPIEQPTRFELVVNARTAKILGLGVPPSFVMRADEIIE